MNLLCDVSLPRRIALRCMVALSSAGFSLCTAAGPQLEPHRLKPVLLDRAGHALVPLAEMPTSVSIPAVSLVWFHAASGA